MSNLFLFANNVSTTLGAAATSSQTTLTLQNVANIPTSFPSGAYFALTLNDAATRLVFEVVYVTAPPSGNNVTVIRGQEGTSAVAWNIGDFCYGAATAGPMNSFVQFLGYQVFTASGTYNPAPGMRFALATAKGGGGGGGGAYNGGGTTNGAAGGGGGEGALVRAFLTAAQVGTSQAVTIGAGGAGGAYNGSAGAGGTTSLGSLVSAAGGAAGSSANGANAGGVGGHGGNTGTGSLIIPGNTGGFGAMTTTGPMSGAGGGAGGGPAIGQPGGTGTAASGNAGGGGSGATSGTDGIGNTGGAGTSGYVEIIEYM